MPNKMLTDNEIIKALECCGNNVIYERCAECPYNNYSRAICTIKLTKDALDLINRQQAENESLYESLDYRAEKIRELEDELKTSKAEAIKEFASEFEYEIIHKEFWKDHPHTSQVWLNGYEQCMRDIRVMLKDKVKEMVGEE